jgi:long-chain acyl-CoA synthetase
MNFLENIFKQLESAPQTQFLQEMHEGKPVAVTGSELLEMIGRARAFISQRGLKKGDRCALLAHNSIRWVAMDLALMAEGLIVVPLYARQAPAELVAMMKDCSPSLICCGDEESQKAIKDVWPEAPEQYLFDEIFAATANAAATPQIADTDPVAIIYTSGTSGEAKGVIINAANVGFILQRTAARRRNVCTTTCRSVSAHHGSRFSVICRGEAWSH